MDGVAERWVMADIWINAPVVLGASGSNVVLGGMAFLSDGNSVNYTVTLPFNTNNATLINNAVRDAAIAAALALGFTVGPGDRKLLLGGAAVG
jgi:hypothetical protein